ncbi:MAG: YkvA family protein [Candidatus Dormibacteria bacterium]
MSRLKRLRSLVLELPQQLRLAYCLARDPRTPAAPKAALGAALAVILNPMVDIPMWVPVLGQMDAISLTVLAVRTFNSQVPEELRAEVEEAIRERRSAFDLDLERGVGAARRLATLSRRLPNVPWPFPTRRPPLELPKQPAPWYRSFEPLEGREGELGAGSPPRPTIEESLS